MNHNLSKDLSKSINKLRCNLGTVNVLATNVLKKRKHNPITLGLTATKTFELKHMFCNKRRSWTIHFHPFLSLVVIFSTSISLNNDL